MFESGLHRLFDNGIKHTRLFRTVYGDVLLLALPPSENRLNQKIQIPAATPMWMVFHSTYDACHYVLMTGTKLGSTAEIRNIRPRKPNHLFRAPPTESMLEEDAAWTLTARAHALAHTRRLCGQDPVGRENLRLHLDTWVIALPSHGTNGRYDAWFHQHDKEPGYRLLVHRGPVKNGDYKTLSLWRSVYEQLGRRHIQAVERVPTKAEEVPDAHCQLQDLLEACNSGAETVTQLIQDSGYACWHQHLRTESK